MGLLGPVMSQQHDLYQSPELQKGILTFLFNKCLSYHIGLQTNSLTFEKYIFKNSNSVSPTLN